MSQWTHVKTTFVVKNEYCAKAESIAKSYGKEISYEECEDCLFNEEKTLPLGGEGSLRISVHNNIDWYKNNEKFNSTIIYVYGDLKDFGYEDDIKELRKWFYKSCNEAIDSATLIATNEWINEPIIFQYEGR